MPQKPRPLDDTVSMASWFGVELRNWRTQRGLSQSALGAKVHVSGAMIGKIEKAERSCPANLVDALDQTLATQGALRRLWNRVQSNVEHRLTDADNIAPGRASRTAYASAAQGSTAAPRDAATVPTEAAEPALPWTARRMVAALSDLLGGGSMERRSFLAVTGMALTAYVHHWSTAEAEPLERAQAGSQVSDDLTQHLQGTIDHLRKMDASAGSGSLAELGTAHLALLVSTLKHGAYTEAVGRRLAGIAADTAAQTGWFYFDSGQHATAQQYLLAALRAAHASGDPRLGAAALSYLAIHGYSTGHPRDAVTTALTAREKIKTLGTPALEAMLLTRQARGHAKLGETQAARRALGQAAEFCAQGRTEHDPHWLYWINEGEIHGQAGSCYLDLGQPQRALASLTAAGASLNPTDVRTRALFLTRAATAHVHTGDIEAACDTAHAALDHAEQLQSARLNDHLDTLAAALVKEGHARTAQDVIDRTAALSRTAT